MEHTQAFCIRCESEDLELKGGNDEACQALGCLSFFFALFTAVPFMWALFFTEGDPYIRCNSCGYKMTVSQIEFQEKREREKRSNG